MTSVTQQYAGDARIPFSFGGSGEGRTTVKIDLTAANVETADYERNFFKFAKAGYVSNFAVVSTDMDTHATPTLVLDVGLQGVSATDDDEFVSNATIAQTGGTELTNVVDESTEAGFPVVAGDYLFLSVSAVAATGAAGTVTVSFDYATTV